VSAATVSSATDEDKGPPAFCAEWNRPASAQASVSVASCSPRAEMNRGRRASGACPNPTKCDGPRRDRATAGRISPCRGAPGRKIGADGRDNNHVFPARGDEPLMAQSSTLRDGSAAGRIRRLGRVRSDAVGKLAPAQIAAELPARREHRRGYR
jgi:hypothetical protein